jgi:DNA-binding response OmpR family regulator
MVVLTTGWSGEAHRRALAALDVGEALLVLPKPYDLDELLAAVRRAVAARRRRARPAQGGA